MYGTEGARLSSIKLTAKRDFDLVERWRRRDRVQESRESDLVRFQKTRYTENLTNASRISGF